jgi:deoxycytidylate deaminase
MIMMKFADLSKKHKKFLALAMKMAEQSECPFRHGSVLVKGGRVLSVGFNKPQNLSTIPLHKYTIHAEEDAINKASLTRGATLYVARINKRGKAMLSMPCKACMAVLEKNEIKLVVYTTSLSNHSH